MRSAGGNEDRAEAYSISDKTENTPKTGREKGPSRISGENLNGPPKTNPEGILLYITDDVFIYINITNILIPY